MFDFIEEQQLQDHHFEQKIEWLIPELIAKEAAILIYAKGGTGKSVIAMALANYAALNQMEVLYLDYDNSLITLIERGVQHKLIDRHANLKYIHRASSKLTSEEVLQQLEMQAVGGKYKNSLIVVDSLKNFTDINNDKRANDAMKRITNIRDAGATIIILSHTNKSESNYQGSNNIRDAVDSMYFVERAESPASQIRIILNSEKERLPVTDQAMDINPEDLSIQHIDLDVARQSEADKLFINEVKATIAKKPGINKTDLLQALGYEKTDKTARARLDQFEGTYWQTQRGAKNAVLYELL